MRSANVRITHFLCSITIVCAFICSIFNIVFAQENAPYIFRHINQPDGLLSSEVRSVVQDSKGFIWILTPAGLQRYDGSRFLNYRYDLNNPAGIMNTVLADMYSDTSNSMLWISYGGIQQFDITKNTFENYNVNEISKDKQFKFEIFTDVAHNQWLAGKIGVIYFKKKGTELLTQYMPLVSAAANKTNYFFTDTLHQQIWLVNFDGLFLLDKKTHRVYSHEYNPLHNEMLQDFKEKNLTAIMQDSDCNIWISSGTPEFFKYSTVEKKLYTYSLTEIAKPGTSNLNQDAVVSAKCFLEDDHHNIWIGTSNAGLLKYNAKKNTFAVISSDQKSAHGLHYNYNILSIFQDREENIWISTDDGINVFNPYRQYFQSVHHEEGNAFSLPKNEIQGFIQTATGDILAGTWGGGITLYDSNWNFKKNISFTSRTEYNMIWSFIQNDDGHIWIGCQHGFIHIYDPVKQSIKTIHPPEVNNYTIRCMTKDKNGNIYLGLHDGKVAVWMKDQNRFYSFDSLQNKAEKMGPVFGILFDNKQRCWVSTEAGLKQFDTEKRVYLTEYFPGKDDVQALLAYPSGAAEVLDDSILVFGTNYGGLNFFNVNTKKFSHLSTKDGLPSASVYAIKKDANNYVWFTTEYGLYKFNVTEKKFIQYTIAPGIINSAFKPGTFYVLNNGKWVTATATEMLIFLPGAVNTQAGSLAKVEITGMNVFDKPVFIDSFLLANKPVRINYKQNFLTIEFSSLNFSNFQQTNYFYRLSAVDKDWVAAGTKTFASYTNLLPGPYVFTVRVDKGNIASPETSFKIIITPPFWRTWWFESLLFAVIVIVIYQAIIWREKSRRNVDAEKLKVQQLNAEQYKNKLEMERVINYFSSSLINKNTVDDVLWDVAKNLIGRMGFEDCMMYLWNADKTKMIQRAGYGPKGSMEEINKNHFDAVMGQGVVGYVMQTKEAVLIPDTSKDKRYRIDEMERQSEITVPIIYNDELIGVIDSEHHEKGFYTHQHLQLLSTIATLTADKVKSIESEQSLQQAQIEMLGINEKLSEAKLEALRSQMNPHFIFNCLNSIDSLIQNNENDKATTYLSKFASLIRSILEASTNNTVPCWKDMETLQLYVELEALRFDNEFCYEVNIGSEINNGDYKVPPLIIQPFVENAIHHGLLNKIEKGKKLQVNVSVVNNHIHYCIEDDGVGRKKAATYNERNKLSHRSMGIQLTTERINLFNHHLANNSVTVTDLYDASNTAVGTRVDVIVSQH